jgi:hypothetical protein
MEPKVVELELAGRRFSIEVGRVAKQSGGSALVRYGDSVVLVTATAASTAREGGDFLPLTVDYQEKTYPPPARSPADSSSARAAERARDSHEEIARQIDLAYRD